MAGFCDDEHLDSINNRQLLDQLTKEDSEPWSWLSNDCAFYKLLRDYDDYFILWYDFLVMSLCSILVRNYTANQDFVSN